jgi:hypothetical protein
MGESVEHSEHGEDSTNISGYADAKQELRLSGFI